MKQYNLKDKTLTLKVNKPNLFVRGMTFFFSFISFTLPLLGIALTLAVGKRFHFGYIIGLFLFGLIGFYLLRVALWNTYGKEIFELNIPNIKYEADYGWFKDGKKTITPDILNYSVKPIGYEDEKNGVLVIGHDELEIESVVKMPIDQLEELIKILNNCS